HHGGQGAARQPRVRDRGLLPRRRAHVADPARHGDGRAGGPGADRHGAAVSPRLAVLVALLGCAASTGGGSAAPCLDTVAMSTPLGVRVVLPAPPVRHHAKLVSEVRHAVDTTAPEADPRIAPTDVGVPLGFTVYVRQSGAFPVDGPAPGFALG